MGAAPTIIEALFQSVTCIQWFWELPKQRYSRLALMSSKQPVEHGDIHCWYGEMQHWFESHGISVKALSLFQYSLDCPHLNMTKMESNRLIQTDIIKLDNRRTWIDFTISLARKMAHYKHIRKWILHQALLYAYTYIACTARCDRVVVDIFTSVRD